MPKGIFFQKSPKKDYAERYNFSKIPKKTMPEGIFFV